MTRAGMTNPTYVPGDLALISAEIDPEIGVLTVLWHSEKQVYVVGVTPLGEEPDTDYREYKTATGVKNFVTKTAFTADVVLQDVEAFDTLRPSEE